MIFRLLGLQSVLDRLFDEGWCLHLAPEAALQCNFAPESTEAA